MLLATALLCCTLATLASSEQIDVDAMESDQGPKTNMSAPFWLRPDRMTRTLYAKPLNSLVKLRCPAGGNPVPNVEWFKDDLPLVQDSNIKAKSFTLRIQQLRPEDAGQYSCVISNKLGSIEHSVRLEVQPYLRHKPVLIDQSHNVTVLEGMEANLFCKFQSDLAHVVHWLRPSDPTASVSSIDKSDPSSFVNIVDPSTGSSYIGSSLRKRNVSQEDNGLYFCVAQTSGPDMTVGLVHLNVLSLDKGVLQRPENLTVKEGEDAVFTCQAHVALHQHILWIKLNKQDENNENNVGNNFGNEFGNEDNMSELQRSSEVLKLTNVSFIDEGGYGCIIGQRLVQIAHLSVKPEEEDIKVTMLATKSSHFWLITALLVSLFCLLLTLFSALIYRKWRSERIKKEQALLRARTISQWTKKIIIERAQFNDGEEDLIPQGIISKPVVRIEKQQRIVKSNSNPSNNNNVSSGSTGRSRLGSEHTTLTTVSEYELPCDPRWEFPRNQLKLGNVLGQGAFGRVLRAEATDIYGDEQVVVVAVKTLKECHSDQEMIDLVSEMDMMKLVDNDDPRARHVVKMLGVCTQDGPLLLIMEYAEHGNLRDFLRIRNNKINGNGNDDGYERPRSSLSVDLHQQLSFARQVSLGMAYLSSRRCLHRDLAARNVLVMSDLVAKIADFGLARDLSSAKDDYYRKMGDGRLPVKWMAPESFFERRYTTQSDIWSFGILLYEIVTMGSNPYNEALHGQERLFEIERLFNRLRDGYRMSRPPNCPFEIYQLMLHCWHQVPEKRPSFEAIAEDLARMMGRCKGYLDVGCCQNILYVNTDIGDCQSNNMSNEGIDSYATKHISDYSNGMGNEEVKTINCTSNNSENNNNNEDEHGYANSNTFGSAEMMEVGPALRNLDVHNYADHFETSAF